jgi:phosphonoacetaldehyde hydrolase
MGTHKRDHIQALLDNPSIRDRWESIHGEKPSSRLLDRLYHEFGSVQTETLRRHCDIIPGVPEVARELRQRGIKIANTTGFDSGMIRELIERAAEGGYAPDLWVCPDQVGGGRPAPWMVFYAARTLEVYPMRTIVKVGDTPADVAEADAAGTWAVSVIRSGNEVGLSQEELAALPVAEQEQRLSRARARLAACGPHYLIDTAAELLPVIEAISARLAGGERP